MSHIYCRLLSPELLTELLRCPLKQLLLPSKRPLLVALISALLQHYLADGAPTDAVIDALLRTCPHVYRVEDALCSRANELLVTLDSLARSAQPVPAHSQALLGQQREQLLLRAVDLYEQVGPGIDLASVICRLRAVGCAWGAVHLCLEAASSRDPGGCAVASLREGHRPQSAQQVAAIEGRNDAYKHLLESLSGLLETSKYAATTGTATGHEQASLFPSSSTSSSCSSRNEALTDLLATLATVFNRKDDLMAHYEVYSWLIDNDLAGELLQFDNRGAHLESYLQHRLQADPQSVVARQLLWKHYELEKRPLDAAQVLDNLAVTECAHFGLDERLECVSRAIVFVRAVIGGET